MTLDHQRATVRCEHCRADVPVSRGSAYEDGAPVGLYLAALHHCRGEPSLMLSIALLASTQGPARAVHLQVRATPDAYEMQFVDPGDSPWRDHDYLGAMLGAAQARGSELRGRFLHVAEHVVQEVPDVREYWPGVHR